MSDFSQSLKKPTKSEDTLCNEEEKDFLVIANSSRIFCQLSFCPSFGMVGSYFTLVFPSVIDTETFLSEP